MHESFELDGKRFAKIFLLDDTINLNQWMVTPESIPIFLKTFIGKPLVEEPNEKHFGAENMETYQILREHEKYRKGTIIDVSWDDTKQEGAAIIEITDNDLWDRIKNGTTIHVSPAIAGMPYVYPDGTKVYTQWYGLHLAMVKDPAYGVLHASIQKTCEGEERQCINQLISTAATQNVSFNPFGYSSCELNLMKSPEQEEKDKENKEMASTVATLVTTVASMQKSFSAMEKNMPKEKDDDKLDKDTAQYGNPKVGVPDNIEGKEKQKGMASVAALEKQVATLTKKISSK